MNIFKSLTMYAITAFFGPVVSYFESCVGERCFTIPGSNDKKTFSNANNWCKDKDSSLAIVTDEYTQETLTQSLNSMQLNEQQKQPMFINLELAVKDTTWYLVNGTQYLGGLWEQDQNNYLYYGYIKTFYGNPYFYVSGSKPNSLRNFICEIETTSCSNISTNTHLYKGRCYAKYETESLTWYQARERCHNNNGSLAMFNYDTISTWNYKPPFDTSWLNQALSYWIGIRWRDWRWSSSGSGHESIYTLWSINEPNTYSYECVCVDPNVNPPWSWTDCDCTVQRQFVCLKIVRTTIITTTTTAAPTTTSRMTAASLVNTRHSNALAIGLGAGIGGGGVFLTLLVVIVVVAVTLTRRRRRKNNGVESQHRVENTTSAKKPNIELTKPDISDVYAHVVPTTQHPASNKSLNDVIYAQPDFSNNPNSASSASDPINTRQGKVKSIMLDESNYFYANAASVS